MKNEGEGNSDKANNQLVTFLKAADASTPEEPCGGKGRAAGRDSLHHSKPSENIPARGPTLPLYAPALQGFVIPVIPTM